MAKRLGNGGRVGRSAPPRDAKMGDNLAPEERAKAEQEERRLGLIAVLSRLRAEKPKVDTAKAAHDAAKEAFKLIKDEAKLRYKFPSKMLDELLADSTAERRDVESGERDRMTFREWVGLPVGRSQEQRELDDRLPDVERDAQFWRGAGYNAGLLAVDLDPPTKCVAAGHVQPWTEGVKDGQFINGLAIKAHKKPVAKPAAEKPKEKTVAEEQAELRRSEAKAKESLANMKPADQTSNVVALPGAAAGEIVDNDPLGASDQGFEASEEELAAQKTRQAVQDAAAGRTTGEAAEEGEAV